MRELKLTPMELYFLGTLMGAKYIDYEYISLLPDVQKRYALHRQETLEALEKRELIEEDFSGNVEVAEEAIGLLTPVFQGTVEGRITAGEHVNIHRDGTRMTAAALQAGKLCFRNLDENGLRALLRNLTAGRALTVSCSKVGTESREKAYGAGELQKEASLAEAIKIIKGEF